MASGTVHTRATLVISLPASIGVGLALGVSAGVGALCGCLSGIPLTPDLDQITISKSEWSIVRYLPIVGWVWLGLWDLYARAVPHRSWLSHAPVIGTLGRLVYLIIIGGLLSSAYYGFTDRWLNFLPLWAFAQSRWFIGWVVGLMISDVMHLLGDVLE